MRLLSLLDQTAWRESRRPRTLGGEEALVVAAPSLVVDDGVVASRAINGVSSPSPKARRLALSAAGRGDDASLCWRTGGLGASAQIGVRRRISGDEEVVVGSWLSWAIGLRRTAKSTRRGAREHESRLSDFWFF